MRLFFLSLFLILSCLISFSFNNISTSPNITNFNRSDYKAGNKNWSISEDEKGVLYIGNDIGLLDYDGLKWNLYKNPNNEIVRSVYAMSSNLIFTGGYEDFGFWTRDISGGLNYKSLSSCLPKGSLHNDDIWRICEVNKSIYFQSFNAIYVYDQKTVYKIPTKINMILLNKVYEELWIQEVNGGIFKINKNILEKIPESEIFSSTEVKSILPTNDGKYLIFTSSMGIYTYDGKSFAEWNTTPEIKNSNLNCGILTKNGNYLIGTILHGIYELSPLGKIVNHFSTDDYLNNNSVLALYEDSSSNIWAGFDRGISKIVYTKGMNFFTDPLGKIGSVYTVAIFSNKFFVGTNQGLYYINLDEFDSTKPIQNFKFIPHTEGQVWSLFTIENKLYCANNLGLCIIDKDLNISYPFDINTGVFTIKKEDVDHILLGTYTGLMIANIKTHELIKVENPAEPISRIEKDHAGNIWLQHMNKGVYRGRLNDSRHIPRLEYIGSETNDTIPYNLQLFKIGGRIAFLGNNKFYTYDDITGKVVKEPVLNEAFSGISKLKTVVNISPSNFWVIGEELIYNVTYKEQKAIISSIINLGYENFSLVDNYENIISLNDSIDVLCLDKGFIVYSNNLINPLKKIPTAYIRSIKISNLDNEVVFLNREKTKLENSDNTITFQFAAQGIHNDDVRFQYQLLGLSNEWKDIEKNENTVTFERLTQGKYTFHIRCVDLFGKSSQGESYEFEILPVWYFSKIAIVLYLILIISLFIIITKYRLFLYKKKQIKKTHFLECSRINDLNKQLQQEVDEKNAELLTQTSSIIQRNQTIAKIKENIDVFFKKQNNKNLHPLYQIINATISSDLDPEEDWRMFLIKFEQKHPVFFRRLRENYPQLTSNDLKLCACLKLNLDSKEISSLMNISVRTIENSRSRLRKKLNIPSSQTLSDYFIQF